MKTLHRRVRHEATQITMEAEGMERVPFAPLPARRAASAAPPLTGGATHGAGVPVDT